MFVIYTNFQANKFQLSLDKIMQPTTLVGSVSYQVYRKLLKGNFMMCENIFRMINLMLLFV